MKRLFVLLPLFCLGCLELQAAPRGFSRFPLNVDGRIVDFTFQDVDRDERKDALVLTAAGSRYTLAIFLQQSPGFSSDPNQVLTLAGDAIAVWPGAVTGSPVSDICILARSGLTAVQFQGGRFRTDKPRTILDREFAPPGFGSRPVFFPLFYREKNSGQGHILIPAPGAVHDRY